MVEVKVDLMGAEPFLYVRPEAMVAIRRFFRADRKERLLYLHGEVNNAERYGIVKTITIPPQVSEHSTVELDTDHDDYFEWHDRYIERCKEWPVIGMAHSFSSGAHHSARDENTDALFGEEGVDRGAEWFFSVTAHSGTTGNDFRVDAVFTPGTEEVRNTFFKQLAIKEIGWAYDVDDNAVEEMLAGSEKMVREKTYQYEKNASDSKGVSAPYGGLYNKNNKGKGGQKK